MEKLTSILVVANHSDADVSLLAKAILLARSVGARIELFACDSEHAYILRQAYDTQGVEKAWLACVTEYRTYLETLRTAAQAPDVEISVDAMCDSPLYQAIVRKAIECRADVVMKNASGAHPLRRFTLDSNDWELMRACPVTLMLIRGKQWSVPPRFAAMVDTSEQEVPRLAETIIHTSEYLSLACHSLLDVVYSEREATGPQRDEHAAALDRLAREYRIDPSRVHVLSGDPDHTLPNFAAEQQYDAIILGALSHRKSLSTLVGRLTGRLVEALTCDFVLVKTQDGTVAGRLTPEPLADRQDDTSASHQNLPSMAAKPTPFDRPDLWQALFGD